MTLFFRERALVVSGHGRAVPQPLALCVRYRT
jgi:hypothetical protein